MSHGRPTLTRKPQPSTALEYRSSKPALAGLRHFRRIWLCSRFFLGRSPPKDNGKETEKAEGGCLVVLEKRRSLRLVMGGLPEFKETGETIARIHNLSGSYLFVSPFLKAF